MNEIAIFGLLDGVCLGVFWLYSRCFLASATLLRKEESKQWWLARFKGAVIISFFFILCAVTGWKAAFLSLAILTPIGLTAQFFLGRKL